MKKKFLALMLVTSMLLSSTSVTAREIAPTVGGGTAKATNEQETPPTVKKIPTMPSTTEAIKEETTEKPVDTTTPDTTSPTTGTKTDVKPVPSADVTEKVDENIKETELNSVDETEKMTKELLIKADKESEIPKDGKILSSYEDTYLVSFPNTDTAKEVYEDKNIDASLNIPFGIATGSNKASTVIEPDVLNNLEETLKTDETKGFKITDDDYSIAVIDTGMPKSSENVEFVSMLNDKGYDDHGHGTMMLESIRKQNADAKILSIKALDKNGYGDAATIYAAIKYAIERNVDVINLSISGFATEGNKIIEDIIKDAVSKGIIVIGAAGNDNLPASAFIPGGIDEAIIVGACNEKNVRKPFSNYGITVDYYADAGSTSEASAIVAGVLSLNNGDIKKLDDTFFKTPDLSIFEEDLKLYHEKQKSIKETSLVNTNEDDQNDSFPDGVKNLSDEELLLNILHRFVDSEGFRTAAVTNRVELLESDSPTRDIKGAHASGTYYVVDESLIKRANVSLGGSNLTSNGVGWTTKSYDNTSAGNYGVKFNATAFTDTNKTAGVAGYPSNGAGTGGSLFVVYENGTASNASLEKPGCTITIKQCVRCNTDTTLHDWVITLDNVTFKWGNSGADDVIASRSDLVAVQIKDGTLPLFITGAVNHSTGYGDTNHPKYKADAALDIDFKMGVANVSSGSFLTGFADLDQWQLFPVGQKTSDGGTPARTNSNAVDEALTIKDVSQLTSQKIWLDTNNWLNDGDKWPGNTGTNGVLIHSSQYVYNDSEDCPETTDHATAYFAAAAGGTTALHWSGARCRTEIGLSMKNVVSPSTITTYVDFETTTPGVYADNRAVNSDTKYAGEPYSYTYDGTGANTAYHDVSKTWAAPGTPYDADTKVVSATFTLNDQAFQLHVPRIRYTYKFDLNKPANATSNPTGQPSDITKPAGAECGDYNATPSLKGWTFLGFYTDRTDGTLYNNKEQMWSDKTFYAHWEPMKYYVQYDGNGATNFNENATNGMQEGEYKQNVVTGSTAYQIFTYDEAGEALRANGFTRRGYDYVCWNTTATRTGTDRNPDYVKPANENWVKGDGTDPTATLDGTHTYPVVTLYAVWQQKPGTETLKVVSEETGNPVSGVSLKLTNTYNNTQISTGTTGADGTVTVSNLHWFPYKWESTAVPAGYKNMQDVTFSINPNNTSDESFLTVNNERILYMKHVKLTINSIVDDIIKNENAPNFMYHVTGTDVAGVTHSYDVMVQTSTDTKKGTNIVPVDSGSEEPYMFAGNYTVTQYGVSRYIPRNALNVKNVTPNGINANANLTNNDDAEVTFPYGIKQYGGFSGVHSLINKLTK